METVKGNPASMNADHDKLMAIFSAALEQRAGDERARYLAEACGSDSLLHQQIESLLAAHEQAGDFLAHAIVDLDYPEVAEGPGTVIGRYRLLEQIGEGGFGAVYMAEQREPVRRKVALKIIKAGMDTREVIARFEAERQALAWMDHPNIARVFDGGATASGRPYFVMELVRGVPITEYCDECQLSTGERLRLFATVCHAVQHAHQKGVIHRDLKPANILVTLHDGEPVPKVIDFGVAKAMQQRLTDKTLFTRFVQMIGTPTYMSPEQAEWSGLDIDSRTDIYSLGVLLYELLTGTTPFSRETLHQSTLDEVRRIIREVEPPKPSTRLRTLGLKSVEVARRRRAEPDGLARSLRGDLDWIAMKALEKDRRRRYETADALAQDIQHYLNHEPVLASPPSAIYRLRKFVRRHREGVVAAAVLLISLCLGLLLATVGLVRASRERNHTLRAEEEAKATLRRMDLQRAREFFDRDNTAAGVALLAFVLRLNPDDRTVAEWLLNELTQRSYPLPLADPLPHADTVRMAWFSPDGRHLLTTALNNTARVWDAATAQPLTAPLAHNAALVRSDAFKGAEYALYAAFSRDGQRVVTASADKTARIWEARTGQPLTAPMVHPDQVFWAQFSPQDQFVLTACRDGLLRRWDPRTGESLGQPFGQPGPAHFADLSPDGRFVLVSLDARLAQVWDVASGTVLGKPLSHGHEIRFGAFSPDGERVATVSADYTGRIWTTQTGEPLSPPLQHDYIVNTVRFSPDGQRIVTTSFDRTARLWDGYTGQPIAPPLRHASIVRFADFSPEAQRVVTASEDGTARVWDASTGEPLSEPLRHHGAVWFAQFSPSGDWVCTASADKTAQVWDVRQGQALRCEIPCSGIVPQIEWSPNARQLLTIKSGVVTVRNPATGLPGEPTPLNQQRGVGRARFSPEGERLVTASDDGSARVWDRLTGRALSRPMRHAGAVLDADFSPDGGRIVTASADFTARVWDAGTAEPLSPALPHQEVVLAARFSPDGRRVATASADHQARLWDIPAGALATPPMHHDDQVVSVQFSPNGRRVVTASKDRTARIWDAGSGAPLTASLPHAAAVNSASFSPDSRWVVTASADTTARVWDAQTGQPVSEPLRHDGEVVAAEFAPDGQRVLTASVDGTAQLWDAQTAQRLAPPIRHQRRVNAAHFSPDGHYVATASSDWRARVSEIQRASGPAPAWLPDLAEAVVGLRLNLQRGTEDFPEAEFLRLRRGLATAAGDGDYARWVKWFLGDRSTRPTSPSADRTVPQYVDNVTRWDPEFAHLLLAGALKLEPTNSLLYACFVEAIDQLTITNPTQRLAIQEWSSHKALTLAPTSPAAWKARAITLHRHGETNAALVSLTDGSRFATHDPEFWEYWARLLETTGQLDTACQAYARAFAIIEAQPGASRTRRETFFWRWWNFLRSHEPFFQEWSPVAMAAYRRLFGGPLPRPTDCPPELIDLTPFCGGFDQSWLEHELYRLDLRDLPHGRATLGGVEFDIRGVWQLDSARLGGYHERGSGLALRQTCRRLHFLHAADLPEDRGTVIGHYAIRYADGQEQRIPIVYGKDVLAWLLESPVERTEVVVGWRKVHPNGVIQQLYRTTWENPRPQVELETLAFVSHMTRSAPFLVALTAEP